MKSPNNMIPLQLVKSESGKVGVLFVQIEKENDEHGTKAIK